MQPSAQGIASLFMGNPGALAARVDQDRKTSPMGIPDDLRQLMALNIVTTENDAAKRQQALAQLQQMAPQGGEPPTVADSVRQQAQQKIQSRMAQEMQKQQAMQQMMGGLRSAQVPEGIPQPQRQPEPQGIDQAPVEFGMAGGGIVSFQEGGRYETPYDRMNRENREREASKQVITLPEGTPRQEADMVQMQNPEATVVVEGSGSLLRSIGQGIKRAFTYSSDVEAMRQREQEKTTPKPQAPISRPTEKMTPQQMERFVSPSRLAAASSSGIPAALSMAAPKPQQESVAPAAPVAPEFQDPRLTPQGMSNMASAGQLQTEADYERRVGAPSTVALDKLMAELERQKAATEGPKAGFGGLAEYLSQIAATPRGLSSLEAGAAGARGVQALEKERAAQRAALTEKQIGLEQQKLNAARDYAKEVFGVGKAAYDKAYERNFNMFKEQGEDVRAAERRAHEMTLEDLRYKRQIEQEERRFKNDMKLRGMPTAEMQRQDRLINMYMKEQEDKGNKVTYLEAVQAIGALGQTERTATPTDRLRAAQTMLEQAGSEEERNVAMATIREILGGSSAAAAGATPLPKNATEKDLVVGTVYQTAKGPAKWTGKVFMPI